MSVPLPPALSYPAQNHILAALGKDQFLRLAPFLELVAMPLGEVIRDAGEKLRYCYFPTSVVLAIVYGLENGDCPQLAMVGKEGMLGISGLMADGAGASQTLVLSAGHAYRISAHLFKKEFDLGGSTQHLLLRYIQAFVTQVTQTAACNRHHSTDQRLCRWLLMAFDRLRSKELVVTQEFIAQLLGVRRQGVMEATGKLQTDGLVLCTRGKITILDRPKLRRQACECYAVVENEYERLLPTIVANADAEIRASDRNNKSSIPGRQTVTT
jgi:CRP-like cAMP-binding protein